MKKEILSSFVIFIVNLSLRLDYLALFFDRFVVNQYLPARLDEIAMSLINGEQYVYPTAWSSFHMLLAMVYFPLKYLNLLTYRFVAIAIINAILISFSGVVIYKIATHLFPKNKFVVYITTGLFSLYYPLYYVSLLTIPESFFTFVLVLLYYLLISKPLNTRTSVFVGFLVGIGIISKPIMLPLILGILFWILWAKITKKALQFKYVVIIGTIFVFVYGVAASVNFFFDQNHKFTAVGNGGINFAIAWCEPRRISYQLDNGEYRWFAPPIFEQRHDLTELQYDVPFYDQFYYYQQGLLCLRRNPSKIITNVGHINNIFDSVFYPNVFHNPIHTKLILIWKYMIIPLIFGFLLYPMLEKKNKKEWVLGCIFLISLIVSVYTSNPGEERYIVPYYFLLILYGGRFISRILAAGLGFGPR